MSKIHIPDGLYHIVEVTLKGARGVDQAVSRTRILEISQGMPLLRGVSDRLVRAAIEDLREQGMLICNLLEGDGYYLAGSMAEYQEFRRKYASYALTILSRLKAMDATAEKLYGASALQGRLL